MKVIWNEFTSLIKQLFTKHSLFLIFLLAAVLALGSWFGAPEAISEHFFPSSIRSDGTAIRDAQAEKFIHAWGAFTTLLLGSGIFSVILKSMVYLGVFRQEFKALVEDPNFQQSVRDEIYSIIYEPRFIGEWTQKKVWERLSTHFFNSLVEGIHEDVSTAFYEDYFPLGDDDYHIRDYRLNAKLKMTPEGKIDFIEELEFYIVAKDVTVRPKLRYKSDMGMDLPSHDITLLTVDGHSYISNIKKGNGEVDGVGRNILSYEIELSGKKEYHIVRHVSRVQDTMDAKDGPTKGVIFRRFVKDATVTIEFPPSLAVFLFESGMKAKFKTVPTQLPNTLKKSYHGLMLPFQGFRIVWTTRG